jgi:nucleotide-binding universal stress UspA family protein
MTTEPNSRPVAVGIDGSDTALGAAQWAAEFAAARGLALELVHATPRLDVGSGRTNGEQALSDATAAVRATHPDLEVRTTAIRGAVASALADSSESSRLLAVGSGSSDPPILGGHVVRITHRAQCPVLVWRAPVAKRTGKPLPVVVGVDDSDASSRALAEAFDIARTLHAQLTVAHMWELDAAVGMGDLGGEGNMDWPLLQVLESQQRQRVDDMVEPLLRQHPNAHVTTLFQDTSPAKGLNELSREAQLVVVGSHGRGRWADTILGSVSQNLVHHADCPVLVVR